MQLLKAVICLGGAGVAESRLIDLLWPDEEADAARNVFSTTLNRLRKLVGPGLLMLVEGKISIDRHQCWIDAWAFDHLIRLAGLARQAGDQQSYLRHAQNALQLFQSDFFADDDDTWVLGCRERLRAQFLDANNALARFWERQRGWNESLAHYRKGLEVDNLSEECYQGAMRCYKNLGFYAEAVGVYNRCKRTLSLTLGTKPSPATEKLYRSLITR